MRSVLEISYQLVMWLKLKYKIPVEVILTPNSLLGFSLAQTLIPITIKWMLMSYWLRSNNIEF